MKTWLDKLCEPLEHPKYKQVMGVLIERDEGSGEIVGKCAEGEIACQNGIKLDRDYGRLGFEYLKLLGIPIDFIDSSWKLPRIYKDDEEGGDNTIKVGEIEDGNSNIDWYIVNLNDWGYTYPQIVEFLRTTFEDAV